MAAKKNTRRPAPAAPSAPHSAPAAHPAPSARAAPGGATVAVQGALAANPGATTAVIAATAGVSPAAAAKTLAALEASGHATRIPGERAGRNRAPATWHPTTGAAAPSGGNGAVPGEPAPAPGTGPGSVPPRDVPSVTAGTATAGQEPHPGRGTQSAASDGDQAGNQKDGGDKAGGEPAAPQHPQAGEAAGTDDEDTGDAGGAPAAGAAPDGTSQSGDATTGPVVPREAAGLAELAAFAAQRAAKALAAGNLPAALSELDAARDSATQARRLVRSASTGRKPRTGPGMRPGQLRDRVRGHLDAHPGTSLTPYEIARVLGNSAGAVANALDRLTELGHAQMATDHPRRYMTTKAP